MNWVIILLIFIIIILISYFKRREKTYIGSGTHSSEIIIHIAGASGSGKTTLGKELKKKYGNKIYVKDLDDLREEHFIEEEKKTKITFDNFVHNYERNYQQFIDNFISKHQNKPIIFVGINTYINGETLYFKNKQGKFPKVTFDLHSDYKFYLDVPTNRIIEQRYNRDFDTDMNWFCGWTKGRKDLLFKQTLKDEKTAKKDLSIALLRPFNFKKIRKHIEAWNKFYYQAQYKFMTAKEINYACQKILTVF